MMSLDSANSNKIIHPRECGSKRKHQTDSQKVLSKRTCGKK